MPKPGEHKTVQARILKYAGEIGWRFVSRQEAEQRRGILGIRNGGSLFFDDLLDAKVRAFNPRYTEAKGALFGKFRHLHSDIYGNREFVAYLRNRGKFFDHEDKRELDLVLIDYNTPANNVFEVTEEFAFHNGHYGTREEVGKLEAKVKSFCAIPQVLALLKDYIVFAEKDEELNKYILRQHQCGAVERVVDRALDSKRKKGLVWHTQGSGKTFTMIKAAELLFKAPEADKPTVLLMVDRNELEDQMLKNLASMGLGNLEHATRIARLNKLLRDDLATRLSLLASTVRPVPTTNMPSMNSCHLSIPRSFTQATTTIRNC